MMTASLQTTQTTLRRESGFVLALAFVLGLPICASAQILRIDDIFTSGTETVSETKRVESLGDLNEAKVRTTLDSMDRLLAAGENNAVLNTTELLTAWLDKSTPEYAKAIWYRGRAYEALGEMEKLRNVSLIYLQSYPAGEDRAWFLIRLARDLRKKDKMADAAVLWQEIVEKAQSATPEESLEGAAILLRATEPILARKLIALGFATDPGDPELMNEKAAMLLESLLITDDPSIPVFPARSVTDGESASFNLRRALLLEIRGEKEAATDAYDRLASAVRLLTPAERKVLETRLDKTSRSAWKEAKITDEKSGLQ